MNLDEAVRIVKKADIFSPTPAMWSAFNDGIERAPAQDQSSISNDNGGAVKRFSPLMFKKEPLPVSAGNEQLAPNYKHRPAYSQEFTGDRDTVKTNMKLKREHGYTDADISRYLYSLGIRGKDVADLKEEVFSREQVLKPAPGSQLYTRNGITEVRPASIGRDQSTTDRPGNGQPTPEQTGNGQPTPEQTVPEQTVPEQTVPEQTVPEQTGTGQPAQDNTQTSEQTGNEQPTKKPKKKNKNKNNEPIDVGGQPEGSTHFETKGTNGNTGEQPGKDLGAKQPKTRQPKAKKKTPPFIKALKHPGTTAALGAAGGVASGLLGAAGLYGASKIYNKLFGDSGGVRIVPA